MKNALLILSLIAVSGLAWGQAFHVTAIRDLQPTDPVPGSRAFKVNVIIGTLGNVRYTAEQTFSWGSQRFEIGHDYDVLKIDARTLQVMMHDKNGRDIKERLNIIGAEEQK